MSNPAPPSPDLGTLPGNFRIAHYWVTDKIRVSTMAIFREDIFYDWWLVETWIFSDDPAQKNRQIIHGEYIGRTFNPNCWTAKRARKVHCNIVFELRKKFDLESLKKDAKNFAAALLKKNNE